MHFNAALSAIASAAILATVVSAQCTDLKVTGDPAFVAEGFEGVKTQSTGDSQWDIQTTEPGKGWVSIHFNQAKCMDLSQYKGVEFDITVPQGGNFTVSWNVRKPDCQAKSDVAQDYVGGNKYVKNGKAQIPFADFAPKLDTKYVEDMTLIQFNPSTPNAGWKIANIMLKCDVASAGTPNGASNTPNSNTNNNSKNNGTSTDKSGAATVTASLSALAAALVGSALVL